MKTILNTVLIALAISACSNNQSADAAAETKNGDSATIKCYTYVGNKDTVSLTTRSQNGVITGTLVYNLYEKDRNEGTIEGEMKDSLLVANYTFLSEGMQSTRQVAFKVSRNKLIEGYGDSDMTGQKSVFRNIEALNYSNSIVLTETPCKE